jgi:hypothetical protein
MKELEEQNQSLLEEIHNVREDFCRLKDQSMISAVVEEEQKSRIENNGFV